MQARKSIVIQWNYILLVVHYSVLVMLNARLWDFSFLGWMLLNLLLAFIFTKYDHYLCIQNPLNQFLPHESTTPTYMWYSFAVLSKFVCAISNLQNTFLFVCSYCSWNSSGGWYFSMLDVLFSWWVFIHLSLNESKAKVLGMPSPEMQKNKNLLYVVK